MRSKKIKRSITKKRTVKKKKTRYKVRNWKEYNQALIDRYDITLWVENGIADIWREGDKIIIKRKKKRGGQKEYSDAAIECLATIQELFHLTYRGIQGFGRAVFQRMLQLPVKIPYYSTINRRRKHLKVKIQTERSDAADKVTIDLVLDSSGLKVYGEGEWKVRKHGWSKHRTWRKIHLSLNPQTNDVEAVELTENNVDDAAVVESMLNQVRQEIDHAAGDGAYDKKNVYVLLSKRANHILIPPRKGARIWVHGNSKGERHPRDENVRYIREAGKKVWKEESGYHMRSLAETGMYRFKTVFSDKLSGRDIEHQTTEVRLKCKILNTMNTFGMPDSYQVDFKVT